MPHKTKSPGALGVRRRIKHTSSVATVKVRRLRRFVQSKFMESAILGTSGLIAITCGGLVVFIVGMVFGQEYLSTPFTDELLMLIKFPAFFIIAAIVKIVIGGKIIEFSVKYISKMMGIKRIIIDPDKPLIIVKKKGVKKK